MGGVKCVDFWGNFNVVVQEFILFDSETWLVAPCIGRTMRGFQHMMDRRLTGEQPRLLPDRGWDYPHPLPPTLPVLCYPIIMVIYPYPSVGVICMVVLHVFII